MDVLRMTLSPIWWRGFNSGNLWDMNITLLSLLPGRLWLILLVIVWVPSIDQTDLYKTYSFSVETFDVILPYLPTPPLVYDTRSIFKRSLTGLNSEFSFSQISCLTNAEEHSLPYYLPIAGGRITGFVPFPRYVKCNQSRPGFELVSPCPFSTTITITPQAPTLMPFYCKIFILRICNSLLRIIIISYLKPYYVCKQTAIIE